MARIAERYNTPEALEAIKATLEFLGNDSAGLTLEDLHHDLFQKQIVGDFVSFKRWIYQLEREGTLERRDNPKQRNVPLFHLTGYSATQPSLFDDFVLRSEVEREVKSSQDLYTADEVERERQSISVLHDIASGHAQETTFAKLIRNIATSLANENPVDLILEIAEWVKNDLNELARKARLADQNHKPELRGLTRDLGFRRIKAVLFFQRLWRFDKSIKQASGVMDIPSVQQMMAGSEVTLDLNKARLRLQERVFGDKVINVVSVPQNKHKAAIGTDATVGDIRVKHEQGSFMPPTPAVLFVASAAMYIRDPGGMSPYWDYDLDPKELEKYEDLDAAQQGLLISPRLRREAITDFRHLRSAAMELRQYAQELRVVSGSPQWYPVSNSPDLKQPPATSLVIRDGRIFPLVHRLDDYDGASAPDDVLYGEVVRREINTFQQVFSSTAGKGRNGAIYAGTVKSPESSWFAMLTFWYLHVKGKDTTAADGFYRPLLNDQAVTHLLFWGMVEADQKHILVDPRNTLVTFQAMRRFSDIAFQSNPQIIETNGLQRAVDEDDENDWIDYIKQHMDDANASYDKHRRGVEALPSAKDYGPFLELCRQAGVAMFYAAPARMYRAVMESGAHFLSPRWEIAVDVSRVKPPKLDIYLHDMLSWLVDEGGLVKDETHAVGGHEEPVEGLPLYIPDVVMQAHEMVVYTRARHIPDVEDRLQQLVRQIREGSLPSIQP